MNAGSNDGLNSDFTTEQLDTPITIDEIIKVLSQLKHNKSADLNGVVADVFIESKQFISPFLCSIFNHIFNTGIYPEAWSKGAIIPIYKKGDPNNPTSYRGITIVNTMAKILSLLLRVCINKWCDNKGNRNS